MKISEAAALINDPGLFTGKTRWADLGCGDGTFTLALASLLDKDSHIYAVDINHSSLQSMADYPGIDIKKVQKDFVHDDLPFVNIDGILMANSLHYVKDKNAFLEKISRHINSKHVFIIVEYNTHIPNRWVPYPVNFNALKNLFEQNGYHAVKMLHTRPSVYNRADMYSAIVIRD